MATEFPRFGLLPAELRLRIWHYAIRGSWTCITLERTRDNQDITVGTHPLKAIAHTCLEARQVLTEAHTYIEGIGWLNFSQTLYIMQNIPKGSVYWSRDYPYQQPPVGQVQHHHKLFDHIQHIVLTPNSRQELMVGLLGWLREIEPPLKSIICVQPWPLPDDREAYDSDRDWIGVEETWDPTFTNSPTELDLSTLKRAIEHGEETGDYRLAHGLSTDEYRARVGQLADRLPRSRPFGRRPGRNGYWVASVELGDLRALVQNFDSSPNLYLQTVGHIRGSSLGKNV
ncbi:uncharacterized protein N7496_003922 [Penicillium cataractarum]|uniref:2EXR domain-containing protein n=1 Tax=Penicillium cataractarum TaxID=2100454 RepID=A0A9W9SPJ9_9EURO|nr:uncharacterized protein N7496_003922 [Penicillium cataractarum]KAJ5381494.1 hypothetical protein N7496_003922 [Penicillium cataractarum]